jgi:hypothetical protein
MVGTMVLGRAWGASIYKVRGLYREGNKKAPEGALRALQGVA